MSTVNAVTPDQVKAALTALRDMILAGEIPLPTSMQTTAVAALTFVLSHPFALELAALGLASVEQLLIAVLGRFGIPESFVEAILAKAGL